MNDPKGDKDDLEQTKRIMERLVRTPPKPHKPKDDGTPSGKADKNITAKSPPGRRQRKP